MISLILFGVFYYFTVVDDFYAPLITSFLLLKELNDTITNSSNYTIMESQQRLYKLYQSLHDEFNKDNKIYTNTCRIDSIQFNRGGLGNRIQRYWYIRSLCFWANKKCLIHKFQNGSTYIGKGFFDYLPLKLTNYSIIQQYYNHIFQSHSKDLQQTINQFIELKRNCTLLFSQCDMRSSPYIWRYPPADHCIYNKLFHLIQQYDLDNTFYRYNYTVKGQLINFKYSQCDITVQHRCGDVLLHPRSCRMFSYQHYEKAIQMALDKYQNYTDIHCINENANTRRYSLNIISQFNTSGAHTYGDIRLSQFCFNLLSKYKKRLENEYEIVKRFYNVKLINNDVSNDLWLIYRTPIVIYSTGSTFARSIASARSINDKYLNVFSTMHCKGCDYKGFDPMKKYDNQKDICIHGCKTLLNMEPFFEIHKIGSLTQLRNETYQQLLTSQLMNISQKI